MLAPHEGVLQGPPLCVFPPEPSQQHTGQDFMSSFQPQPRARDIVLLSHTLRLHRSLRPDSSGLLRSRRASAACRWIRALSCPRWVLQAPTL